VTVIYKTIYLKIQQDFNKSGALRAYCPEFHWGKLGQIKGFLLIAPKTFCGGSFLSNNNLPTTIGALQGTLLVGPRRLDFTHYRAVNKFRFPYINLVAWFCK